MLGCNDRYWTMAASATGYFAALADPSTTAERWAEIARLAHRMGVYDQARDAAKRAYESARANGGAVA